MLERCHTCRCTLQQKVVETGDPFLLTRDQARGRPAPQLAAGVANQTAAHRLWTWHSSQAGAAACTQCKGSSYVRQVGPLHV